MCVQNQILFKISKLLTWLCVFCNIHTSVQFHWTDIDLFEDHLPIFFTNNPEVSRLCSEDPTCPYKKFINKNLCWGYETDINYKCTKKNAYYIQPTCPGDSRGWVNSKEEQRSAFYNQGDFGFVEEQRKQMQTYCSSNEPRGSKLECSDHLQFCRGKNIMIDFRDLKTRKDPIRYQMDVLKPGQIKGFCQLNKTLLNDNLDHISPLQSWGPELRFFETISDTLHNSDHCDIWVDDTSIITKIDATVNMYHHFCDFFNIYAAQHVNSSNEYAFSKDVQVLIWESYPYNNNFKVAWDAFTNKPLWTLDKVAGKRMCFKNVMFPLLPRMIFGLYYNTPLIWGCENSGLFHSFSHHFLHRLRIPLRTPEDNKVHITFLSRLSKYRRVLNEDELLQAISTNDKYIVRKAQFGHSHSFKDQLLQDQWTDLFIGMHGAGLTHILFLPDWAVVFELYNCGDTNCYKDLARLRGVQYITWEDNLKLFPEDEGHHPKLGAHEKFTNYEFDVQEFIYLVSKAVHKIESHPKWQEAQRKLYSHDEL